MANRKESPAELTDEQLEGVSGGSGPGDELTQELLLHGTAAACKGTHLTIEGGATEPIKKPILP